MSATTGEVVAKQRAGTCADWLVQFAASVSVLVARPGVREKFRGNIQAWADHRRLQQQTRDSWIAEQRQKSPAERRKAAEAAMGEGDCTEKPDLDDMPLPFKPGRQLSRMERYVVVAAVHDYFLPASSRIGPEWNATDPQSWAYNILLERPRAGKREIADGEPMKTDDLYIRESDLPNLQECLMEIERDSIVNGQITKVKRQLSHVKQWDDTRLAAEIGVYRKQNARLSLPQIAEKIGCHKSTLYRRAKKSRVVNAAIMMDVNTPAERGDIDQIGLSHRMSDRTAAAKFADGEKFERLKQKNGVYFQSCNSPCNS